MAGHAYSISRRQRRPTRRNCPACCMRHRARSTSWRTDSQRPVRRRRQLRASAPYCGRYPFEVNICRTGDHQLAPAAAPPGARPLRPAPPAARCCPFDPNPPPTIGAQHRDILRRVEPEQPGHHRLVRVGDALRRRPQRQFVAGPRPPWCACGSIGLWCSIGVTYVCASWTLGRRPHRRRIRVADPAVRLGARSPLLELLRHRTHSPSIAAIHRGGLALAASRFAPPPR